MMVLWKTNKIKNLYTAQKIKGKDHNGERNIILDISTDMDVMRVVSIGTTCLPDNVRAPNEMTDDVLGDR